MRTATGKIVLYFCIDTIKDTRLGTLAKINDDYAFYALLNGYMERWTDDPATYAEICTSKEYFDAYAKRDKETFKLSLPTDHALDAQNIISDLEVRHGAGDPTVPHLPEVHVNCHPYNFTPAEKAAFLKVLRAMFKCRSEIRLINVAPKDLTLEYIRHNEYVSLWMYNYREWIEAVITKPMNDGIYIEGIPDITFYFPALSSDVSAKAVYRECERELGQLPDVFANVKLHCAPYIGIDWVSPIYYSVSPSILFPKEKQKEAPPTDKDMIDPAFLFDPNNPNDVEKLRNMPDSES